jgi:hypothetical protein
VCFFQLEFCSCGNASIANEMFSWSVVLKMAIMFSQIFNKLWILLCSLISVQYGLWLIRYSAWFLFLGLQLWYNNDTTSPTYHLLPHPSPTTTTKKQGALVVFSQICIAEFCWKLLVHFICDCTFFVCILVVCLTLVRHSIRMKSIFVEHFCSMIDWMQIHV